MKRTIRRTVNGLVAVLLAAAMVLEGSIPTLISGNDMGTVYAAPEDGSENESQGSQTTSTEEESSVTEETTTEETTVPEESSEEPSSEEGTETDPLTEGQEGGITEPEPTPSVIEGVIEQQETVSSEAMLANASSAAAAENGDHFQYSDQDKNVTYGFYMLDKSQNEVALVALTPSNRDNPVSTDITNGYTIPESITIDAVEYKIVQLGYEKESGTVDSFYLEFFVEKLTIPSTIRTIVKFDPRISGSVKVLEYKENENITEIPAFGYFDTSASSKLEEVILPNNITSISDKAFWFCVKLTKVNFPASLESIGDLAFANTSLAGTGDDNAIDLTVCPNLTSIGDAAFAWDGGGTAVIHDCVLEEITFNEDQAIWPGITATKVKLPDSVTEVGAYAFATCSFDYANACIEEKTPGRDEFLHGITRFTSFELGNGLEAIGEAAFGGSQITSLTLPSSVKEIGRLAFARNYYLKEVHWASAPNDTSVGDEAFNWCLSLESINIPEGVKSIGASAFQQNSALTEIEMQGVEIIGEGAFESCPELTKVRFPQIRNICKTAFVNCGKLSDIVLPEGLETIGASAFADCPELKIDLVIPSTARYIGVNAFGTWSVYAPSGMTYGNYEVEMHGSGIRSLTIAEGSTDLVIANGAFAACTGLNGTDIVLPERVKKLGTGAFHFIQNASFHIENPEMELANVFYDTNDHTEPEEDDYDVDGGFPAYFTLSVGGIGLNGLDFVKIYDPAAVAAVLVDYDDYDFTSNQYTVNNAGETVFEGYVCSIPDPWASDDVFDRQILPGSDNGLTLNGSIVYYPNEINEYSESHPGVVPGAGSGISPTLWGYIEAVEGSFDYLMNHNNHTYPYGEYDEEDSVPVLKLANYDYEGGAYTYYPTFVKEGTTGVQKKRTHYKVRFDGNGGDFPSYADAITPYRYYVKDSIYGWFPHVERTDYQFDGWYTSASGGIKVTTADSVDPDITKLYAHWRDPSSGDDVYDLTFGTGVTGKFYEATGRLVISGSGPMRDYEGDDSPLKEKKLAGFVKTIEIENGITRIGDNAFAECTKLTAVTIPATVTSIGAFAFQGCTSLKNLSRTSQITNIGEYAFQDCSSLTAFSLNSGITVLNDGIFQGCSSLTGISLPGHLTSIGGAVFSGCSSIKNIIIPATVTKIGSGQGTAQAVGGTFAGTGIESITIPAGVTYILGDTFKGCDKLASVTIPDSVTTIYSYAFSSCTSLESITLPSDLTMIANNAFEYCTALTEITIPESVSDIDDGAFYSCTSLNTVNMSQDYDSSVGIGEEPNAFGACYALETINLDHVTVSNGYGYPLPYVFTFTPTSGTPTTITKLNADYPYTGTLTKTSGVIEQYIGDGADGKNVTANFNVDTGVLTISGNGAIGGYNNSFLDSENIRDKVRTIVINNGVTAIPQGYFDGCASLESITLNNVTLTESYTLPFVFYDNGSRITVLTANTSYNKTLTGGSTYTVSYDPQGGTVVFEPTSTAYGVIYSPDITPKTVREGGTYGELPVVIREGFDFDGWFTAATGGTEVDEDDAVTKTQTIYAQWTGKDITVRYDGNGGYVQSVYATWTSTVGEKYDIPRIEPERDGYTFLGWYTAAVGGEKITSDTVVTEPEDHTLYAHWTNGSATIKTVKITLNGNGGKLPAGSTSSFTRETGEEYGEMPEPIYAGYNFLGWYTAKTGGERITDDIHVKISKDHTLYAQWELIDITVAYDPVGGVFTSNEGDTDAISGKRIHIKRITDKYGPLPTVTKAGYTFDGWYYTDVSGEVKLSETTGLLSGEDHIITARWLENTCKVILHGSTDEEMGFPDIDRAVGWMNKQGSGSSFTVILEGSSKLTGDVTLPAAASEITFTSQSDGGVYSPATMDLDGHVLTYGGSGTINVTGLLNLDNSNATKNGAIKLTNTRTSPTLRFEQENYNDDHSGTLVNGVDINVPGGQVIFADSKADRATESPAFTITDNVISAKYLVVSGGKYEIAQASVNVIDNKPSAVVAVGDLTVASNGSAYLEPGSTLHISNKATLYNIYLGQTMTGETVDGSANAVLSRVDGAGISINGKITAKSDNDRLAVNTLNGGTLAPTEPGVIFTTNIKAFPIDLFTIVQPTGYERYDTLMQIGSNVMVAAEWITVKVIGADGTEEPLKSFAKWSDMISYVNGIANKSCEYIIELSEDVTTMENLTIPGAAGKVTFRGTAGDADGNEIPDTVKLTHLGNLLINTDVTFENIVLESQSINTKTGEETINNAATITINGRTLEFINSYALNKYATVTGGGNSLFVLRGNGDSGKTTMPFTVVNAFTVANIDVENYDIISETNAITVANEAYLTNSKLECKTNMTFKNLISCDGNNILSYAEQANGTLKITGYVNCTDSDPSKEVTVLGSIGAGTDKAFIYTDAIAIDVKYIRNANVLSDDGTESSGMSSYAMKSYTYNAKNGTYKLAIDYATKPLLTAAMAAATCFRVADPADPDSTWFVLKKNGNNMLIDDLSQNTVVLYRVAYESGVERDEILGNFVTLQDALTEIDRYADPYGEYKICIDRDKDEDASKPAGKLSNLTMPKKLSMLTITSMAAKSGGRQAPARIFMNNALNLNSDLELDNVILADNGSTKLNINLGGYRLTLNHVECESENRIGNITGNGVGVENYEKHTNSSALCLRNNTNLTVSGNLDKVKYIDMDEGPETAAELDQVTLTVLGKTNVGTIWSHGDTFYGSATYKTSKDKSAVTEVVSNVTINDYIEDTVEAEEKDSNDTLVEPGLHFGLKTPQAGTYANLDTAYLSGVGDISALMEGTSYRLMKAQNADTNSISYINGADTSRSLVKSNGFICLTSGYTPYTLYYGDEENPDNRIRISDFASFKDVVDEINKQAKKRDYYVEIVEDTDPTTDHNMQTPAVFAMPNAKNISSLTISGFGGEIVDAFYTGAAITLTSPTTFDNVNLVRVKLGADKKTYEYENISDSNDEYLTATTLKTAGYDLTFAGKVTWDTPLIMDGAKKAALILDSSEIDALVKTKIDKADDLFTTTGASGIYVHGSINNFATISLGDKQEIILRGFKTGKINTKTHAYAETYVTPSLSVTNADIIGGRIEVGDFIGSIQSLDKNGNPSINTIYHPLDKTPATVTITSLTVKGHKDDEISGTNGKETISVHGKFTVNNLTLLANDNDNTDQAGEQTIISVDRDFTIAKGTVVSATPNAVLVTRHNAAKVPVPFLNIQGTVERQDTGDRIGVALRRSVEEIKADAEAETHQGYSYNSVIVLPDSPVSDSPAKPDLNKRQLLTASVALADCFAAVRDDSLTDVDHDYSNSYLVKNKTAILVYDKNSEAKVTVAASVNEGNYNTKTAEQNANDVLTYYSTWAEAIAAIQSYNDMNSYYTIIINDVIGVDYANEDLPAPIALNMPSKAKGLYITAVEPVVPTPHKTNNIYYTGAITLGCPTEFIGVDLNPLASVKKDSRTGITTVTGAKSNITANAFNLTLTDVTVGKAFNAISNPIVKAGTSQIGNISSTTGTIILDSDKLYSSELTPATSALGGNISSTKGSVIISDDATVAGTVSALELTIDADKNLKVIGDVKGNASVTATRLIMNGKATLEDTLPAGKITVTDIENNASPKTEANTIKYGRNAKNATNLEIKGSLSGENPNQLIINMVASNGVELTNTDAANYGLSLADMSHDKKTNLINNSKLNLSDAKKLFVAPKLQNGLIKTYVGGDWPSDGTIVKANNGFWIVKNEDGSGEYNNTTKVQAVIQGAGKNGNPPAVTAVIDTDATIQGEEVKGTTTLQRNKVGLELKNTTTKQPVRFTGAYLDWNQAIAEINNLNDPDAEYELTIVSNGIYDTNLTDANWRSVLTMPGNNKAKALYVKGQGSNTTAVRFSGAITTYGHVEIEGLQLNSQNAKGNAPADFNITMNPNSAKTEGTLAPGFFITDVTTMADSTSWDMESVEYIGTETANRVGFIGKISGSKAKTENLHITGNNLRVKGVITNINDVVLCGSDVIAVGGVSAAKLSLLELDKEVGEDQDSHLTALAASTVGTVVAETVDCNIGTARNNKNIPLFTVTGAQDPDQNAQISVRSVDQVGTYEVSGSTRYNVITYLDGEDGRGDQTNIGLVIAPRSDALCFYAITVNNGFMYKDASNIVYAGNQDDVPIMLTRYKAGDDGYPEGEYLSEYYAKTYADAIANINSIADPNSAYKITFLKKDVKGSGNPSADETTLEKLAVIDDTPIYSYKFGALTWPKANTAKSLTISGTREMDGDNITYLSELRYTGTLKPSTAGLKVRFEDIILTEGAAKTVKVTGINAETNKKQTVSRVDFVPTYMVTPDLSGASGVDIIIGSNVNTLKPATPEEAIQNKWALSDNEKVVAGSNLPNETLVFTKVVSNAKYTTNTLGLNGQSILLRGASTIQNLQLNGQTRLFSTTNAFTINGDVTDITPEPDDPSNPPARGLEIAYCYPDVTTKTVGFGASPITINGNVANGTRIKLKPYIDEKTEVKDVNYVQPTVAQIGAKDIKDVPEKSRNSYRFAAVKKAGADRFEVLALDGRFVDRLWDNAPVDFHDNLRKYNGGLYINTTGSLLHLTRKTDDENGEPEVFVSECDLETWDAAVAEINGVADKNSTYVIELLGNVGGLGTDDHPGAPLASLNMPTQAKEVVIRTCASDNPMLDEEGHEMQDPQGHTMMAPSQFALITTAKKVTLNCPVTFEDGVSLIAVAGVKNQTPAYKAINYDIVTGTNCLTYRGFENVITSGGMEFHSDINTITGKGSLVSDHCNVYTAGKIAVNSIYADGEGGIFTLADISAADIDIHHGSMITADKNITATNLYLGGKPDPDPNIQDHDGGATLASSADVTATNAVIADSNVLAQNITFKTKLDTQNSRITAGMNKWGDGITKTGVGGKLTINQLALKGHTDMGVKQDKNGKSQLIINGAITGEGVSFTYEEGGVQKTGYDDPRVIVQVHYNDYSKYAQLYDGIVLATAPKAEASWFGPATSYTYHDEESGEDIFEPAMGRWADGYTIYKSGNTICYGRGDRMKVRLISQTHDVDDPDDESLNEITGQSDFATFEEAVKEIGALNRRYQIGKTWYYEDYTIELLEDIDIKNAKGAYIAPTLPTAVDVLTIRSRVPMRWDDTEQEDVLDKNDGYTAAIRYSGNLTLKSNLTLQDIILEQQGKLGNAVLGNFVLTLIDAYSAIDVDDEWVVDTTAPGYDPEDVDTYEYIPKFKSNTCYDLEFAAITGANKSGRLVLDESVQYAGDFKYDHSTDPYTVCASSVSGLYAVELWDNAELDVSGAMNVGRIRYMTEISSSISPEDKKTLINTPGYHTPVGCVSVGGGLTVQQIQINNSDKDLYNARLVVNSTKTNKITGIANKAKQFITIADYNSETAAFDETKMPDSIPTGVLNLILNNEATTGARVLNVKNLDPGLMNAFKLESPLGTARAIYRNGDNIVMGNP